jgi:UrcA family protein
VTFEELDLKKEARVTELYARLKRAAEKVCEGSDFSYASGRREQRTCYQDTLQTAVS